VFFIPNIYAKLNIEIQPLDRHTKRILLHFNLDETELLYKHSLDISVDSPYIKLDHNKENRTAIEKYDQTTKETHIVFENEVTIEIQAKKLKDIPFTASLHINYQTNLDSHPQTVLFPLQFEFSNSDVPSSEENMGIANIGSSKISHNNESFMNVVYRYVQSSSTNLSALVEQTKSLPIRLILVFLLGILLSFTPCIYPMIPITVGILQSQKSSSLIGNFSRSFAYTLGLSTTFACFGLAASITGPLYGKLLMSPLSVSFLVFFLGFLGLSMFGLYDVQLPKFLQLKKETSQNGSLVSSFLFGAASGTIASPCVSPGLILLLSIVATLNNIFLGFVFLFAFGFGLSVPLLLIGTFSSSMNMLPRAGMWMIEIKKIFGIMLFAVSFYYLNNIINQTTLMYLISLFLLILGLTYFMSANKTTSQGIKKFNNLLGFSLLCLSVITLGYTLQSKYLTPATIDDQSFWITDYEHGLQKARLEDKLLFLDFWAEYCSVCKAINKKLVSDEKIVTLLQTMVRVKINGTYDEEPFKSLKKQFNIVGFPTFLIVDPNNNKILKEWHSELYTIPKEQLIAEIRRLISTKQTNANSI
jgi:thiol:disulfide interchange protein DsbD